MVEFPPFVFADEPCWHKLLDLISDLALCLSFLAFWFLLRGWSWWLSQHRLSCVIMVILGTVRTKGGWIPRFVFADKPCQHKLLDLVKDLALGCFTRLPWTSSCPHSCLQGICLHQNPESSNCQEALRYIPYFPKMGLILTIIYLWRKVVQFCEADGLSTIHKRN